jgi:hypothetical protein
MSEFTNPLSGVKIASPCPADWNSMLGSERVRFCGQCRLNVYNLSAMTQDDAEALITNYEGRLCLRFYRRRDGSILTEDCPVGLSRIRQRVSRIRRAFLSSLFGFLAGVGGIVGLNRFETWLLDSGPLDERVMGRIVRQDPPREPALMGEMVYDYDRRAVQHKRTPAKSVRR